MAASTAPLLIKRYASRRLYNTQTSDYVTLEDIAGFIRDGREVKIIDLKSGDDLTRQYLLQIIAEHESRGESVLPLDVLTDLFLAASFEMLREGQSKLMENMAAMPNPMATMPGFDALQRQQQMFLKAMMGGWRGGASGPEREDGTPAPPAGPATPEDERDMAEIRRQLAELQKRVSKL
ncbi:hypothetical protein PLESTB_001969100 [Pleodorina starrii]|uniref:PHA accumulation regulator DNA-binding N-terminal domain-containing protein n=1 Tax=Pleodorina starrii TaxID=330485 RepID=A0A9W6C4A4_9CHLO|nr:hypothetical protein PLESTB_001969100 [Pleodorina starrii]